VTGHAAWHLVDRQAGDDRHGLTGGDEGEHDAEVGRAIVVRRVVSWHREMQVVPEQQRQLDALGPAVALTGVAIAARSRRPPAMAGAPPRHWGLARRT
jgi:hypothetical protein